MDGKVSQLLKMVLRFLLPQLDVNQIPTVAKTRTNTENVYKKVRSKFKLKIQSFIGRGGIQISG